MKLPGFKGAVPQVSLAGLDNEPSFFMPMKVTSTISIALPITPHGYDDDGGGGGRGVDDGAGGAAADVASDDKDVQEPQPVNSEPRASPKNPPQCFLHRAR